MFLTGGMNRSGRRAGRSKFQPALRGAWAEEDAGAVRDRRVAGNRREPIRGRSLRSAGGRTQSRRLQARTPDDRRRSCCKPGRLPRPLRRVADCRHQRTGKYYLERGREPYPNGRHDDAGNDRHSQNGPRPLPFCADRTASSPLCSPATGATARSVQTGWISSGSYAHTMPRHLVVPILQTRKRHQSSLIFQLKAVIF